MSLLWQQIIIGAAVGTAIGYLVWHYVRSKRKRPCANCGLMQLAEKKQADDRRRSVSR